VRQGIIRKVSKSSRTSPKKNLYEANIRIKKFMRKQTVKDIKNLTGKTVFMTADFNISLSDGKIANDTRIVEALPTIEYLLNHKAKIVLCSHLGRPKGVEKKYSLLPVAQRLTHHTKRKVHLIDNFCDTDAKKRIDEIADTDLVLLENIRFCEGEKKNDQALSKHLASFADYFVNDAFGASHRVHASTVGITNFLPSYAGLLMANEIEMLSYVLEKPKKPFLVFIGGAKTPEKMGVIEKLLDLADTVALGGAIANTFLAAWGFGMGRSMVDYEMIEMARVIFWKACRHHSALILPEDVVITDELRTKKPTIVDYNTVPEHVAIFDIGPKTIAHYNRLIKHAKTIIWNGPMGLYEDKNYRHGTDTLLQNIAQSHATSIIGGGDTLTSLQSKQYVDKITHVSTGGSAMLAFLEKGSLPGIEVLKNK
jgi:phosphoglycerate kinase